MATAGTIAPPPPPSVVFTDAAAAKVGELIAEEDNPNLKLRVFISGGGCSGFQYGFTFDIRNPNAQTTCGCGSSFTV